MPVMASDKRFSIVPNDQRDVAAVKHIADLLKTNMKELVLAAMWRGLRQIARERDLLLSAEGSPMDPDAIMACRSAADLVKLIAREVDEDETPYHPPPAKDETASGQHTHALKQARGRPQSRAEKRRLSQLDSAGKKVRGRSEGIGD